LAYAVLALGLLPLVGITVQDALEGAPTATPEVSVGARTIQQDLHVGEEVLGEPSGLHDQHGEIAKGR
jgi:hypothetical protein